MIRETSPHPWNTEQRSPCGISRCLPR